MRQRIAEENIPANPPSTGGSPHALSRKNSHRLGNSLAPHSIGPGTNPNTITSLTCQGANRYNINNAAVYAYSFSSTATNPAYFTAYLSGAMLETMLLNQYLNNTAYSSCYFANNNGVHPLTVTIMGVTSIGVGANVDAGALSQDSTKQLFTEVDFAYTNLSFGPNTNVKKEPVGTPEEQAKAFQAYKAQGLSLPRR